MGKRYAAIDEKIRNWMENQKMFFVGSAPLSADGLVNISPKGHDALRIIDGTTLAYLDYGGSGVETIAHVRENGRIVIMMCAFEGPPKIFRFYGSGEIVTPLDEGFTDLADLFDVPGVGVRAVIRVNITRIQDSCGYGVPNFAFEGHRESSQNWFSQKSQEELREYQLEKNVTSLDGIPALTEPEAQAVVWPGERPSDEE